MQRIAASYIRTSRDNGDETYSLDSQARVVQEYAAKRGIELPDARLIEDEYTGFTLDRPGFNQIMRLIQERRINCLIVHKVNRIARKSHLADYFLQEIVMPAGVELHIVEWGRPIDGTNKSDMLLYNMQANFGQFDAMDIKERTTRGRNERIAQNIWMGQGAMVYGYQKQGTRKDKTISVVAGEAEVVRLIFYLYVNEGRQILEIVRFLNAQGIASPSQARTIYKKSDWNKKSIARILRDPRYTGVWYSLRYEGGKVNGKSWSRFRAQEEWVKHDFPQLAIIDTEQFKTAQALLDNRRDSYAFPARHEYLFARRLTCLCQHKVGTCPVKSGSGQTLLYYLCQHKKRFKTECKLTGHLRADELDVQAWDLVERLLRNPELELDLLRKAQAAQKETHTDAVMNLEAVEAVRARYHADLKARYHADLKARYQDYKSELITKDIYLEEKAELDERLRIAEELHAEYQASADDKILSDSAIRRISAECRKFADYLDRAGVLTFSQRQTLIDLLGITGRFVVENKQLVLYLSIHNLDFDKFIVRESRESCIPSLVLAQGIALPDALERVLTAPITLRLVVQELA